MTISSAPSGQNFAVVKSIKLINMYKLTTIPSPASGEISYNDLMFATGAAFEEIYHTIETGSFEDNESRTEAGRLWSKSVNFEIPKIRTEVISGLKNYEGMKNVAIVTDLNNTSFLVYPLRILRKKHIPGQFTSKNAILVQMSGQSIYESPVITDVP